ncbi:MAG: sulfurtransferase-like selenium metabolism protein YedF [Myxococcales bacterium]|nr:MAG: sulfurtransferase-like selenium metabolism protein YedF [Myxococcales bacterium]
MEPTRPTVDARGKLCPLPLVMTKQVYDTLQAGQEMLVLVDNPTSAGNVESFVRDAGGVCTIAQDGPVSQLTIFKGQQASAANPEAFCATGAVAGHVVYINTDRIGLGDDDLGPALMQTFLQTIKDVRPLPSHVIFIHRGVFLLEKGKKTAETIGQLEASGIRVLVCGTCLDFFNLMDRRACGQVSNMYDILKTLSQAGHIVRP